MPCPPRTRRRCCLLLLAGFAAAPAAAWDLATQEAIADWGMRLAPPDLRGQLLQRRREFQEGVAAALADDAWQRDPSALPGHVEALARQTVEAFQRQQPFDEFVRRLGGVSALVAAAADPALTGRDVMPGRDAGDFAHYVTSARPRLRPVFAGQPAGLEGVAGLRRLVTASVEDSRRLAPRLAEEYRRIGHGSGRQHFDDRSTAYAVASLSYSRAITDVALGLRYIWLAAGGADSRAALPPRLPGDPP